MANSNTKPVRRFSVARCEREAALAEAALTTSAVVDQPNSQTSETPTDTPAASVLDGDGRRPSDCESDVTVNDSKDLDKNRPDPLVNSEERPAGRPAEGVARREDGSLKPGSNLNPTGKNQWTERSQVRAALETLAEDVPPESMKDRRIIWKRFIELVKRGDPWAVKEYFSRRWPAPRASSREDAPSEPVTITVVTGIQGAPGSMCTNDYDKSLLEATRIAPPTPEAAPESTDSPQPDPAPSETELPPSGDPKPLTWGDIVRPWEDVRPTRAKLN